MKYRRRKYLIDTIFQSRIIIIFVALSLLGSFIAVAVFNLLALNKLDDLFWSSHIRVQSTGEYLRPLFVRVNIISFMFVSLAFIVAAFLIIKKTSGPLYRMSKDISKVAAGDLTADISLRKGDDFRDVAHELDIMVKSLRNRFSSLNEQYKICSLELEKGDITDTQKCNLESIASQIETIELELSRFKIND